MRDGDLPLFSWRPPCHVLPFPLHRQVGKVRDTARKLLSKSTDRHADHYRGQVTDAIARKLERIGLPDATVDEQVGSFWVAVECEMARLTFRGHRPGGAA